MEAARHFPPVAGMVPHVEQPSVAPVRLANGRTLQPQPGSHGYTLSSGANMDPTVFDEPHAFRPGRKNAERLLSDLRELRTFGGAPLPAIRLGW